MAANNPMVRYIASLRTQNQGANPSYVQETRAAFLAELRAGEASFPDDRELHIPSRLDSLIDAIAQGASEWRLVVLTGDAGDGKTQACAGLADAWGIELDPVTEHNGWIILKDASELPPDRLAGILDRWHESQESAAPIRLLVAINEGRLRAAKALFRGAWASVVEPSLDGLLGVEDAEGLDAASRSLRVLVLNFRHRLFVRSGVRGLLASWTATRYWEQGASCGDCPASARCPILANARDLRDQQAAEQVADVLMWLHLAGQRLPFRPLQGILAFAFTGGLNCAEVQGAPASSAALMRHRYYSALFLTTGREGGLVRHVQPEPAAAMLAALDGSNVADRTTDERLLADWRAAPPTSGPEGAAARAGEAPESLLPILRQQAMVTRRGPPAGWERALRLLEGPEAAALTETVVRAINRIAGHLDNGTELQPILMDPEGLVTFDRRAVDVLLPAPTNLNIRRAPAVAAAARAALDEVATVVELVAAPSADGTAPVLAVDVVLMERLLQGLERGASVVSLGGYRTDLVRFLSRTIAAAKGGAPALVLRIGGHRIRLQVVDKNLRLETV